jgi:hypothetical protein
LVAAALCDAVLRWIVPWSRSGPSGRLLVHSSSAFLKSPCVTADVNALVSPWQFLAIAIARGQQVLADALLAEIEWATA